MSNKLSVENGAFRDIGQHRDEFVATFARQHIGVTDGPHHVVRPRQQHMVADVVAVRVVHLLESGPSPGISATTTARGLGNRP